MGRVPENFKGDPPTGQAHLTKSRWQEKTYKTPKGFKVTRMLTPNRLSGAIPQEAMLPFPRPAWYAGVESSGFPFCTTFGEPIIPSEIAQAARFPVAIMPPTPLADDRQDILNALRNANSDQLLLAYVMPFTMWDIVDDTGTTYYQKVHYLIRTTDSWLRDINGDIVTDLANVNFIPIYTDLAKLYRDMILSPMASSPKLSAERKHLFDGLFFDVFQPQPPASADYTRAGYPSQLAFNVAWQTARKALPIASLPDPSQLWPMICGNTCAGESALFAATRMNGSMQERFPTLWGGTWASNMSTLWEDEVNMDKPTMMFLFTAATQYGGSWDNWSQDAQRARWGLASSCLSNACHVHAPSDPSPQVAWRNWWYDEYSVDSSGTAAAPPVGVVGWLGRPLAARYLDQGIYWRQFERGLVIVNQTASPKTVAVGPGYKTIKGTVSPTVNTGLPVTSLTIDGEDARMLWRT